MMKNMVKELAKKAMERAGKVKGKVIDKTAKVMSAVPVEIHKSKARAADMKRDNVKMLREMKDIPDKGNESDPLFRARIDAINDAFDRERDAQKKALEKNIK